MVDPADTMVVRLLGNDAALEYLRGKYPKRWLSAAHKCDSYGKGTKGGRYRCYRKKGHEGTHIAEMGGKYRRGVQVW
jgi:hypothetical protein